MEFRKRHVQTQTAHGFMSFFPFVSGVIVCFLLFLQVVVSNRLATAGYEISQIDTEIETTTEQNELLKEQIASASALTTLKSEAEKLGFNKSVTPAFLKPALPVALGSH